MTAGTSVKNSTKKEARRDEAGPKREAAASQSFSGPIALLQQTIGNQGVQHLVRSGLLQAKLTVSRPDDMYEQEADRVADRVMRMPDPVVQTKPG